MAEAALAPAAKAAERVENGFGAATAAVRRTMVERQLRTYDVTDVPVLQRFLDVPREAFLPGELAPLAYSDKAVSLNGSESGKARALLAPLVLARFLQGAEIREHERVLVVGGAGYSAALLAGLAREVVALECDPVFAERAKEALKAVGADGVRVETGPLEKGCPAAAPYDAILVEGAVETGLDALFAQLTPDGRLLAIETAAGGGGQQAMRYARVDGKPAGKRSLFDASAPTLPGFETPAAFAF
jgi:protein-L-isoaspartate(D-aspartate) O-methyltransferase